MKALACAGYDYMKLMVAELQRQLDDIEGTVVRYIYLHVSQFLPAVLNRYVKNVISYMIMFMLR